MDKLLETQDDLEKMEIELLLEAIYRQYGYDFRNYAPSFLRRRLWHRIKMEQLTSVSGLLEKILHHPPVMYSFLHDLTISVTEMYRDPGFFSAFRKKVVPVLKEFPLFRIWHAGCSTGEEAYSMAILLYEEGLWERTKLYATDINDFSLQRAKKGVFPIDRMQQYTKNYLESGGKSAFSEYYAVTGKGEVFLHDFLKENLVFANHNLATDKSFNEFNVIVCRNVLIYFNKQLQNTVFDLFHQSLSTQGYLCLGDRENVKFMQGARHYEQIDQREKIFRKIGEVFTK